MGSNWWSMGSRYFFIYLGAVFWVIGYDTIYGCQDRYEDKLFGVNNTAITMEKYLANFVKITYFISIFFFVCWHLFKTSFWLVCRCFIYVNTLISPKS